MNNLLLILTELNLNKDGGFDEEEITVNPSYIILAKATEKGTRLSLANPATNLKSSPGVVNVKETPSQIRQACARAGWQVFKPI